MPHRLALLTLAVFCSLSGNLLAQKKSKKPAPKRGPARWEAAIQKFEAQDKASPRKPGGVLFVGSSSIRLWKLGTSFPDLYALNRGFGGSEVSDSLHFADRIVLPYKPRLIVMYAGDNDINKGATPEQVAANFAKFVAKVRTSLPNTKIAYIAIKPSLARWSLVDKMRDANSRIRKQCEADQHLSFVDIDTPMIGDDGKPQKDLFADDGLHLNDKGYQLWAKVLRPYLKPSK